MASEPTLASYIKEQRKNDKDKARVLNKEGAWAAVGFAVVLIVFGLPVWWRTTTVYRAPLPYSSIQKLAGIRRQHFMPIAVLSQDHSQGLQFVAKLQKLLKKPGGDVQYHVHSRGLEKLQKAVVRDSASLDALVAGMLDNTILHSATLTLLLLSTNRAQDLLKNDQIYVTRENLLVVSADADAGLVNTVVRSMALDGGSVALQNTGRGRQAAPPPPHKVISEASYSLTITLMLPQPHRTMAYWDSEAAVQAYLTPLLEQLRQIHTSISVRCQQLYMTPLSGGVRPQWQQRQQHYALPHTHLPLAINAIEAKLGSFVSTAPALHFIVYVPSQDQTPLHIYAPGNTPLRSNSFVVPRWGGVIIHNPPPMNTSSLPEDGSPRTAEGVRRFPLNTHRIMTTILTQLHTLLPIPQLPPTPLVTVAPPVSPELAEWQLDALARARVTQYYHTTSTTLQSLCELVGEISNMVVSEEVGGWVWQSVEEWEGCGDAAQEGRLREASLYCTQAHSHAHSAFFHPSMLALLYFPDNQKYAIYVPLFLPVSIPVLLSFKMLYTLAKSYWNKQALSPHTKTD